MPLPPLLADRPLPLRLVLLVVLPAVGGFATGATLGVAVWLWVVANVVAVAGGVGGGFEHDGPRGGAARGALGGAVFGAFLVLADATVVGHRVAAIAHPAIAQLLVTVPMGALLGAAGGALRARAIRRAAVAPAVL